MAELLDPAPAEALPATPAPAAEAPAAAPVAEVLPVSVEDEFAAAFAAIAQDLPSPGDVKPAEIPAIAEVLSVETPPVVEIAPVAEAPVVATPEAKPSANQDTAVLLARIAVLETAAQARGEEKPPPTNETAKPFYSDVETATLKKYREEWGDVAAAEALIRKQEHSDIVKYVFDQVTARYEPLRIA